VTDKKRMTDSCPKEEVEAQDECSPCGAGSCDADEEAGCDTCE